MISNVCPANICRFYSMYNVTDIALIHAILSSAWSAYIVLVNLCINYGLLRSYQEWFNLFIYYSGAVPTGADQSERESWKPGRWSRVH